LDKMNLHDPLFTTYVVAASLMILKAVAMAWLTVIRMMEVKGGYRSPEDLKRTPLNPAPNPAQLLPNERVERIRRIACCTSLPTSPGRSTRSVRPCGAWARSS
jgi:glutathione S-transferase